MYEQGAIEFNLHYRVIQDMSSMACYRIKLIPGQQAAAGVGNHVIRLTWLMENTTTNSTLYANCTNNQTTDQVVEFDIA